MSTTNCSRSWPARTSSAAATIALAIFDGSRRSFPFAAAAAFLICAVATIECRRRGEAADREIVERTLGLGTVIRVRRHADLAKRIAFDPELRHSAAIILFHMLPAFLDSMVQLITKTSTDLPPDVRAAMGLAVRREEPATRAGQALTIIAQNIDQAESCEGPICQDTGMPTFEVKVPVGVNQIALRAQIREAVAEATRRGKLRPNSVDSITGENSGNNLGPGTPIIHFEQWEAPHIEVKLILKGGGCENTNAQYALPSELEHLGRADRSLEGVRKCILHAVWKAQGKGCSPGAVGVCIGGDRTSGYLHAKEQLFRTLDDTNPDPRLAAVESAVMDEANKLSVGPMGFSGQTSLIGCKIGALNRLPASFFVSVAYDCWAFRRLGVHVDATTGADNRLALPGRADEVSTDARARSARRWGSAHRPRGASAGADLGRADPLAERGRRRAHLGADVHRT